MAPLQFCTTASRQYLPFARALAQSIAATNPGSSLFVLLPEDHHHTVNPAAEPFEVLWNEDVGIEAAELHRMHLIFGMQFFAAVKPWLIETVIKRTASPVLYIDSDIQLFGDLADLGTLIDEHGALVCPHTLTPYPQDGLLPDDTTILSAGTFNAGMIGVGARGHALIEFLQSRLRRECRVDVVQMRVNEQRWLDYFPSFGNCHVLRDPGVNVAYWNLHERPLEEHDGQLFAGGFPLRAFHFSGYELEQPTILSKHAPVVPRIRLEDQLLVARLCASYRERVIANGFTAMHSIALDFDELPGGIRIDPTLRAIYLSCLQRAESEGTALPPDGYDLAARDAFIAWAKSAYPAAGMQPPAWTGAQGMPNSDTEELIRRLATSSAAALSNLDGRLRAMEERLDALTPLASMAQ